MGVGSVFSAVFILPRLRKKLSPNASTILANLLEAVVYLLMAFVRQPLVFMIVAALAGMGWTVAASELWVAAQRAIPGWARGRMNATIIMVSQGGIALGGMIWGLASQIAGVSTTLIVAAVAFTFSLVLGIPLSINFTTPLDSQPISDYRIANRLQFRTRLKGLDHLIQSRAPTAHPGRVPCEWRRGFTTEAQRAQSSEWISARR